MVHEAQAITWCVLNICVQKLADVQKDQWKARFTTVSFDLFFRLGDDAERYERAIQTCQQDIQRFDEDLGVALQALRAIGQE